MRAALLPAVLLFSACGGGGGGGTSVAAPVRLSVPDLDLGPATTSAELLVQFAQPPATGTALLQVAIELPPALTIAPGAPLQPGQPLATLKGEMVSGRYLVVCGDDRNREALPLRTGLLFSLRLATTTPRQVGTFQITLRDLLAARSDSSNADGDVNPVVATVIVR